MDEAEARMSHVDTKDVAQGLIETSAQLYHVLTMMTKEKPHDIAKIVGGPLGCEVMVALLPTTKPEDGWTRNVSHARMLVFTDNKARHRNAWT